MDRQLPIDPEPAALARAGRLTTELIELVAQLRAAVAGGEAPPATRTRPVSGRLRSGDLRAAMSGANPQSARRVPHLFG
jgi:hypothetical protein